MTSRATAGRALWVGGVRARDAVGGPGPVAVPGSAIPPGAAVAEPAKPALGDWSEPAGVYDTENVGVDCMEQGSLKQLRAGY